jgi:hypothetical protein
MTPDEIVRWDWTCGSGRSVRWYRASPSRLADAWTTYAQWRARWWPVIADPITEVHGTGEEMVAHLEPDYECWIVAETNSEWTALLPSNAPFRWDVADLVPCLMAQVELGHTADDRIKLQLRVIGQPTDFTPAIADLTRPDRIVSCVEETRGWNFRDTGQPLDFEETDRYLLRDRSQRLTEEMLRRYSNALGIPLGEDEVLTGNGLYIREVPFYQEDCSDPRAAQRELAEICKSRQ